MGNEATSAIVIGNGPSALLYEAGAEIDKFDVVIRINRFHIKGFEKFVGSKTDIWATTYNKLLMEWLEGWVTDVAGCRISKLKINERKIWARTPKKLRYLRQIFGSDYSYEILYKNFKYHSLFLNDILGHISSEKDVPYKGKIYNVEPDTGFLTIVRAIEKFENIHIHGFDFYEDGLDDDIKRYYHNLSGETHAPPADVKGQRFVIEELHRRGHINFLSEETKGVFFKKDPVAPKFPDSLLEKVRGGNVK